MDNYYMDLAIKQAKKALKLNEVPVGAIIVKDNKIISQAHNKKEKSNDVTKHAELIAISKASKKINNWRLDDCILYVTMEPCMMCSGAIEQSRIKKIVYGSRNENYGCTKMLKNVDIVKNVRKEECKNLIQSFFKNVR